MVILKLWSIIISILKWWNIIILSIILILNLSFTRKKEDTLAFNLIFIPALMYIILS